MNDLCLIEMESDICNFADDTIFYTCDTLIEAVINRFNDYGYDYYAECM